MIFCDVVLRHTGKRKYGNCEKGNGATQVDQTQGGVRETQDDVEEGNGQAGGREKDVHP